MGLTKRSKERLLRLADGLENIPKQHFNLDIITERDNDYISDPKHPEAGMHDKDFVDTLKEIGKGKEFDCKTAACAIGWTPAIFPRNFKWNELGEVENKLTGESDDIYLVDDFFGISPFQCAYLFTPGEYYTKKEEEQFWFSSPPKISKKRVIKRIRKFVEKNGEIK